MRDQAQLAPLAAPIDTGGMGLSPQASATRDSILDAAERCFAASGFRATTLREVAKEAGVTQPLINHYFGSKQALFDAALVRAVLDYDATQSERWSLPAGDIRFFTEGMPVLFRWLGEHRQSARLVSWGRLEGRLVQMEAFPEAQAIWHKVRQRFVDAQDRGIVRADVDPDVALVMIDALFKGYWDRADELPNGRTTLAAEVFELAFDTLLRGLLTPEAYAEARARMDSADDARQA